MAERFHVLGKETCLLAAAAVAAVGPGRRDADGASTARRLAANARPCPRDVCAVRRKAR